jgi:hypothetical protein
MAVAMKRKAPINPRTLSAALNHARARAMAEEHADRALGAEDFEARESFSGGGSDEELQEYHPTFDPSSSRCNASALASAGGTDRNLAGPQFAQNCKPTI